MTQLQQFKEPTQTNSEQCLFEAQDFLNSLFQESFKFKLQLHPIQQNIPTETSTQKQKKEAQLMDFSSMFKKKHPKVRKKPVKIVKSNIRNADLAEVLTPRQSNNKQNQSQNNNQNISQQQSNLKIHSEVKNLNQEEDNQEQEAKQYFEIPMNLTITQQQMHLKKCLDVRRWFCLQRPQYAKSCGISSLISCWNYLFSTLGTGTHRPLSQQQALTVLGFQPPFSQISFGKFTGNPTLIKWFRLINSYFGIKNGWARIFWKLHGKNRTIGIDPEQALVKLKQSLLGESKTFIYHCFNHYMCPIGYQQTPTKSWESYKSREEVIEQDTEIIIGQPSRRSPCMRAIQWSDIVKDIDCQNPYYMNIRKLHLGMQARKGKRFTQGDKLGGNLHCLILFEKVQQDLKEIVKKNSKSKNKIDTAINVIEEEDYEKQLEEQDNDQEILECEKKSKVQDLATQSNNQTSQSEFQSEAI